MAFRLDAFLTQVDELTSENAPQNNGLAIEQRYRCIRLAVQKYSEDRPDIYVEDVTGADTRYYAISTLTEWVEDFSRVTQVEYPAADVSANEGPTWLEDDQWRDNYWQDVSGTQTRYILFDGVSPSSSEAFRATYTIPYTWTVSSATFAVAQTAHGFSASDYIYYSTSQAKYVEAASTILATHQVTAVADADNFTTAILQTDTPQEHFIAICHLAACIMCREISTRYSRIGSTTLGVDSGAHQGKADNFGRRADTYCKAYANLVGIASGDSPQEIPASGFVDLSTQPAWKCGRRYLFHGRRCR